MVLVPAPSICLLVFFFIGLGDAGKKQKNDQIIIHVPYKIHHHHYPPQVKYVPVKVPEIKTEIFPEESFNPDLLQPTLKNEQSINQTSQPSKKKQKQKKLKKILKRKPKPSQRPPLPQSPQSFPLETFLGLDKILGEQINKQKAPAPIPARISAQPKDYQFSDGTDFEVKKPKQLAITSYAFTTLGHSKPQPIVGSSEGLPKPKSERSLDDNPDYEHVGYILIPKNHNPQFNRNY